MKWITLSMFSLLVSHFTMCSQAPNSTVPNARRLSAAASSKGVQKKTSKKVDSKYAIATFAGGCFWCMQPPFDKTKGVLATFVGYTGGKEKNPTYKQVAYGRTSHTESIQIVFDPRIVSYQKLLDIFWRNIDPTAKNRQFVDVGTQYRAAIFWHNARQKKLAEASKLALSRSKRFSKPIVTEITKASIFYKAETYHQKYYKKNPFNYYRYRRGSGRDAFIQKHWGKAKN